jgi:hypothetical protein
VERTVSVLVSFTDVRARSATFTNSYMPSSRQVLNVAERWSADLESVLGATPHEFESRILPPLDQAKRGANPLRAGPTCLIGGSSRLWRASHAFHRRSSSSLATAICAG